MARLSQLWKSNNAHLRLNHKYLSRQNTAKNRAYGNYHAYCIEKQNRLGRILKKTERRKLFADSCRYDGYSPKK